VNQLLVSSLDKLKHGALNAQLYNESAATLEKLSILKAWAEVYVVAVRQQVDQKPPDAWPGSVPATPISAVTSHEFDYSTASSPTSSSLLSLVGPELSSLLGHWLAALRDAALLSLPPEFADQLPVNGGAFYTQNNAAASREYYANCWPAILMAASMWLRQNDFGTEPSMNEQTAAAFR
jgi:hypothetical protein